jgi:hypothetical protein
LPITAGKEESAVPLSAGGKRSTTSNSELWGLEGGVRVRPILADDSSSLIAHLGTNVPRGNNSMAGHEML